MSLWTPTSSWKGQRWALTSFIQFEIGHVARPELTRDLGGAEGASARSGIPCFFRRLASARSMIRGKSIAHSWGGV